MPTKREWLRELKVLKKEPRALSSAECDELVLLLGGTVRPKHRPKSLKKPFNWAAIGSVVFSFLENAEVLVRLEADLQELNSPGFLGKAFPTLAAKNHAEAERVFAESMVTARPNLESRIAGLRPISAKNRAEAERMASKWFSVRGQKLNKKAIENTLTSIQEKAGLKQLQLAEWRELKAQMDAYEKEKRTDVQPTE